MVKSVDDRLKFLEAENAELRRLWIETEGDTIEVRSTLQRYLDMPWYRRLVIDYHDERLHKDKTTPLISRRQAYIFAPLHQFFNEGGLDIQPPSRKKWLGIKRKLYDITGRWHSNEAKHLRASGGTVYRGRHGIKGLFE